MANRPYTGFDGNAPGQRAGLERFVELTIDRFERGVWNNGTWGPRAARNPGVSKPSGLALVAPPTCPGEVWVARRVTAGTNWPCRFLISGSPTQNCS